LELKTTSKRKSPGGEIEIDTYASNYKPVNGVLFPFSIEQKVKGQTQAQITVDKFELDVPVDEASFKMPQKAEKPGDKPPDKPGEPKTKEKPPSLGERASLPAWSRQ